MVTVLMVLVVVIVVAAAEGMLLVSRSGLLEVFDHRGLLLVKLLY